jgi:serine/threonine-protein kinase HipA
VSELVALIWGREMGRVHQERGRLSFVYAEEWRHSRRAHPLSLSMPIAAARHGHPVTHSFLWGLLPDSEAILDRWARRFQVSAQNPFALLSHVGEECAGAVQFVRPDRVEVILGGEIPSVEWLDEHGVAERLRQLRADVSAWRSPRDTGQFSLAGAQPKTALLLDGDRWGVPAGRTPTTHILKPPTGDFDGHAENEHYCLSLARQLGLPTASSSVLRFEDQIAIAIARYDRQGTGTEIVRVHQEDMCQAMGVPPTRKYENEGGPGAPEVVELLRTHSLRAETDVLTFLDALAFSWLTAGTDGHAKNYSLLFSPGGGVRLAPLYDLASALPYDDLQLEKVKLAMKIGPDYRLRDIGAAEWRRLAEHVGVDPDRLIERILALAERTPDEASALARRLHSEGLRHDVIDRLAEGLCQRARKGSMMLARAASGRPV